MMGSVLRALKLWVNIKKCMSHQLKFEKRKNYIQRHLSPVKQTKLVYRLTAKILQTARQRYYSHREIPKITSDDA